ncbi:MAG TPA: IS4 family transposase [Actinomycetes bacterium]|nr:IS4 family transposase [Actinomycetes bacterium]
MIGEIGPNERLDAHLAVDALARVFPRHTLEAVIDGCGVREQRCRKLPAVLTLLVCIAMHLYAHESLPHVFRALVSGLRWCWPRHEALSVTSGALCQARERLGAQPLVTLFRTICQPLATSTTPGAFLCGYRLMALDGTRLDLPDTPANAAAFGRPGSGRGQSAWPQAQVVALGECGTHALCDAGVWRCDAAERAAAQRLLRSLTAAMLVCWDRGLHSFDLLVQTQARGAQFLGRLPRHVRPELLAVLSDGTSLVCLRPSEPVRRRAGEQLVARLIRYTLDDPPRPGHADEHRLLTSLLDPAQAPAAQLVVAYHQRWELELTIDELKTHQRPARPLRSHKPVGVIQELYALFLAHYLVRAVMAAAATTADLAPTRLSFLDSLRLIREALPDLQRSAPGEHGRITQRLRADLLAAKLPWRRNRSNPRVVKRKMTNFRVKRPAHRHWPQPTKPFQEAIVLLI